MANQEQSWPGDVFAWKREAFREAPEVEGNTQEDGRFNAKIWEWFQWFLKLWPANIWKNCRTTKFIFLILFIPWVCTLFWCKVIAPWQPTALSPGGMHLGLSLSGCWKTHLRPPLILFSGSFQGGMQFYWRPIHVGILRASRDRWDSWWKAMLKHVFSRLQLSWVTLPRKWKQHEAQMWKLSRDQLTLVICFFCWGIILPSCIGIMIRHYKDPYEPINMLKCHKGFWTLLLSRFTLCKTSLLLELTSEVRYQLATIGWNPRHKKVSRLIPPWSEW